MYKGLTKKEIKIAKHYENITEAEADAEHKWAEANGLSFSGQGALSKAIATVKERRKQMVSIRLDLENIEGMKERAKVEGIPYQTLINSVLRRFLNGDLVSKDSLKKAVSDAKTTSIGSMEFCEGMLDGQSVVIVKCGVGKVNAGNCAQILISIFGVNRIINTGVAGSLDASIDIGDIVVSTDAVQHDFDLTPLGYAPGALYEIGSPSLPADVFMRESAVNAVRQCAPEVHVFEGRVCTGDQFIASAEQKDAIIAVFGGLCCEMEGGAIAQICCQNEVPFVIIRAISDKADGSAEMDYTEFEHAAAVRCAAITRYMITH
jgi:adenosylhomocysteine nucleosidase